MAKSLSNFITIRDFLKHHSARLLRFLIIKNHYRSPIDYTENSVLQAKRELARIDEFVEKLKRCESCPKALREAGYRPPGRSHLKLGKFEKEFENAMGDDFNTPKAIAGIFELITKGNSLIEQNLLSKTEAKDILRFLKKVDRIFNFIFWQKPKEKIPQELLGLAEQRQKYREQGEWQKADEMRKKIKEMGWWVEDTKDGSKIKRLPS